jgi:two-component system response regulator CpxR
MSDLTSKPDLDAPQNAPRILLIQDDPGLARLLTGFLESHGFWVEATESAYSIARAKTEEWDLIILDIMPTGPQGSEVLRQLRAFSIVPLLVLVGEDPATELLAGLESGVDSYLPRTASAGEVVAHIRSLSSASVAMDRTENKPKESAPTALSIGGLRLEPEARAVYANEVALTLTRVEFELLALLMRHEGRIYSRAELLSEVRGRGLQISERSIDAHFAGIRRKFREGSQSARFILKIRGVGYVLMDPGALDT